MGKMIDGRWTTEWYDSDPKGHFIREDTVFRGGRLDPAGPHPPAAGRYHLYVSLACPWAHRTLIFRKLKGLEKAISLSVVDFYMGKDGWRFTDSVAGAIPDSVNGARFLHEIYKKAKDDYTGRVSVPVLWDKERSTIVNNESKEIIRIFDSQLPGIGNDEISFFPSDLEDEIANTMDAIYQPINNGVYRCGFATTQQAYDEAVDALFGALDHWEVVLGDQRYLLGSRLTAVDWCLFTSLVRFDLVYHYHFKCNVRRLQDYPNLWGYVRDLYQHPGVAETCNFEHIKHHYFESHDTINPHRIVPRGPAIDFDAPHDRARLGG